MLYEVITLQQVVEFDPPHPLLEQKGGRFVLIPASLAEVVAFGGVQVEIEDTRAALLSGEDPPGDDLDAGRTMVQQGQGAEVGDRHLVPRLQFGDQGRQGVVV